MQSKILKILGLIGPLVLGNASPSSFCLLTYLFLPYLDLGLSIFLAFLVAFLGVSMPIFLVLRKLSVRMNDVKIMTENTQEMNSK